MSLRIKSYYDSSIQTAMRQARHEFGEDVMLVTSRIASSEFRYLGDFEVVFAVDELTVDDNETEPPAARFAETFRQQLELPFAPGRKRRETAVARIHSLLPDLGLEPAVTEALSSLVRSSCPHSAESAGSHRSTPVSGSAPHPRRSVMTRLIALGVYVLIAFCVCSDPGVRVVRQ